MQRPSPLDAPTTTVRTAPPRIELTAMLDKFGRVRLAGRTIGPCPAAGEAPYQLAGASPGESSAEGRLTSC